MGLAFQKFSGGDTPDPHSGRGRPPPAVGEHPRGRPLPHPTRSPPFGVGPQTLVPLNFSAVVAPLPVNQNHKNWTGRGPNWIKL